MLVAIIPLLALCFWFSYIWWVSRVLPSVEHYPGGKVKAEGYVERVHLSAYRRTGHWVTYYPNEKKESEGAYKGGKKEGVWTVWDSEGRQVSRKKYIDDKPVSAGKPESPTSNSTELRGP